MFCLVAHAALICLRKPSNHQIFPTVRMTFWQKILSATGEGPAFPWLVLVFIVIALVLFFAKPQERMRLRTALLLFALSLVVFLVAAVLLSFGVSESDAVFRWTRWTARIFQWLAIVNIAADGSAETARSHRHCHFHPVAVPVVGCFRARPPMHRQG